MDKRVIRDLCFTAFGGLCGASGAYICVKNQLSAEYDKNLKEAVEKETSELDQRLTASEKVIDSLNARIDIYERAGLSYETALAIAEKNDAAAKKAEEKLAEGAKDIGGKNYFSYSKSFVAKDEEKENPEAFEVSQDNAEEEDPYIISGDSFSEDHDEYRKVSCMLYTEDEVLCESSHNEIIDIQHVGKENIEFIMNNDIDLLYVRNDYLGIDYEIDKYEGSYTNEVLGEDSMDE